MPHIHDLYDFVISVFIVNRGRVLLIFHKNYGRWLPIGGHIELNEDPEQALFREIKEECGLKVRILAERPPVRQRGVVKPILTPAFVDVHRVKKGHKHIAFVYLGTSPSDRVRLHEKEHSQFRWFKPQELKERRYAIYPSIRFYCLEALKRSRYRVKAL